MQERAIIIVSYISLTYVPLIFENYIIQIFYIVISNIIFSKQLKKHNTLTEQVLQYRYPSIFAGVTIARSDPQKPNRQFRLKSVGFFCFLCLIVIQIVKTENTMTTNNGDRLYNLSCYPNVKCSTSVITFLFGIDFEGRSVCVYS